MDDRGQARPMRRAIGRAAEVDNRVQIALLVQAAGERQGADRSRTPPFVEPSEHPLRR